MSSRQADQQASNAVVAQAAFYAAALQRAHGEAEQHEQTIAVLRADKQARDKDLHGARLECDNLRASLDSMRKLLESSEKAAESFRKVEDSQRREIEQLRRDLDLEKRRTRELRTEFDEYKRAALTENERLQRVVVEAHNERDKNVKAMQQASEAFGTFKGEVAEILNTAGFLTNTPHDMLHAVRTAVTAYKRQNVIDAEEPNDKPKALPPKGKFSKSF